jgi:hypothetical protein
VVHVGLEVGGEDQNPVLCCEGKGKEGFDVAASPLCMFCQEGRDERGSAKRRAASHHALLGVATAQLLCHLLGGHRVMSIHTALGQLHVEANGGSQAAQGVEGSGSISGRALQVDVMGKGKDPYLGMELLAAGSALGASERRGKTPACHTGCPSLPRSARGGARRPGDHHAQRAACVGGRSIG